MSDKFQNKYRIPSARAIWWDYGRNAGYFITICTQGWDCYFGNVCDGKMELSETGEIAQSCWQEIPQHFPYVQLDSFVVMPNHVHGIIIINKPDGIKQIGGTVPVQVPVPVPVPVQIPVPVETLHATSLPAPPAPPAPPPTPATSSEPLDMFNNDILNTGNFLPAVKNEHMASISPKRGTLGSIVRSYKSAVTNKAHLINAVIGWQARFYDSIIRDDQSWQIINEYIINNPLKWKDDKFYIQ